MKWKVKKKCIKEKLEEYEPNYCQWLMKWDDNFHMERKKEREGNKKAGKKRRDGEKKARKKKDEEKKTRKSKWRNKMDEEENRWKIKKNYVIR